ncbi:MAG: carbon starvation protein A [Candidatus Omnitrophica bacterium]|nr:carbon starvation protein A [Candidatus Omnitrophota bacterium]
MNSLVIAVITIVLFVLAYRFYARKLEALWQVDAKRSTPAFAKFDSLDYIPAKNWLVLFGHHFSSISGAGPIIGPVIAVILWGWLPAFLWVLLGSIFIGGVHDFGSLVTSVREGGSSVADIARHSISKKAKIIFSLFVWLALVLVIAVFAHLCADTFVKEPRIVVPSLGLIPLAILVGYFLYFRKSGTFLPTLLGLACIPVLVWLGSVFSIHLSFKTWLLVLFLYCCFASVLPVNILLQPRDYLSSFLLFFGMAAGYLGLILAHPKITMPAYTNFSSSEGYLWPALFVTVACGAVSGFHSLISSGTSSKQIANERFAKRIGYGAMLTEGLIAVLAIIATAILFNQEDGFASVLKHSTPIGIFARGYAVVTSGLLGKYAPFIAVVILNAFILTTLDTATRISRYLTEELFHIKNRFASTAVIISFSALLAFSGKWNRIWPVFGASNQLVAALALFVLSCWLLAKGKTIKFTIWPALFMLVTTIASLILQAVRYFKQKDILLFTVVILLLLLAGFMVYEVLKIFLKRRKI